MRAVLMAVALAALAVWSPAQREPEQLLRLSFRAGDVMQRLVDCRLDTGGVLPMNNRLHLQTFYEVRVKSVTAAGAELTWTVRRIKMRHEYGENVELFDSAVEEEPGDKLMQVQGMIGETFTVLVDPRGRAMRREVPDYTTELDRGRPTMLLSTNDFFLPTLPLLPDAPVATGSEWSGCQATELHGADAEDFEFESKFKLAAVADGTARIEQSVTVRPKGTDEKGTQRKESERAFELDLRTGRIARISEKTRAVFTDGATKFAYTVELEERPVTEEDEQRSPLPGGADLDKAKLHKARTDLAKIYEEAKYYKIKNGRFPTMIDLTTPNEQGRAQLDGVTTDPWGNDYVIRKVQASRRIEVVSFGPDGIEGTDDDLSTPRPR